MSPDAQVQRPAFIAPPRIEAVRQELPGQHQIGLNSFSALELAAVRAESPLRGLLATSEMLSLDDTSVAAGMVLALDGLAARGLVATEISELAGTGDDLLEGAPPLGGDLAVVSDIRRQPALLGVVVVTALTGTESVQPEVPSAGIVAVLHGFAIEGKGLVGLLEESESPHSVHHFVLCTPDRQAERIMQARAALVADPDSNPVPIGSGTLAVTVDLYVPDATTPRHTRLILTSSPEGSDGTGLFALRSSPGGYWEERRNVGDDGQEWISMFRDAVRLTP